MIKLNLGEEYQKNETTKSCKIFNCKIERERLDKNIAGFND